MLTAAKPLLIGLLLTTAPMAVLAQTEAQTEPQTEAPAAAAPAAPAADAPAADAPATDVPAADAPADAAAAADSEPRVGEPYVRETFGAWSLRCLQAEAGQPDPCQLYQLLEDADGNAVAEFSTFPLPEGNEAAAGATIVVPLETLLTENLRVTVDGGEGKVYPFTFCNAAGCIARIGFTAAEVAAMKAGNAAVVRMVPAAAPDQEVALTMSLAGFTAGFDSVDAQ